MSVAAACDFFVVPSLTFKLLYCFVILSHDRHKIVHVNVTQHPTDEWAANQTIEALPVTAKSRGVSIATVTRPVEDGLGAVVATSHAGGFHHRYGRAA